MKAFKILAFAAAATMLVACGPKGGNATADGADSLGVKKEVVKKASELKPSKAMTDSVSYLLGYVFSGYIKNYNFGNEINFGKLKAGLQDFLNAKAAPGTPDFEKEVKISPEKLEDLFNRFLAQRFEYLKALNGEEGQKFIAKSLKNGYEQTASGLLYKISNPGSERKIKVTDTLEVNYKGTFIDGSIFDQSTPERGPIKFVVGPNSVIRGWIEAVQLVGEGGALSVVIPAELAYGPQGRQGIEPNKTLLFDMEIVSVKPLIVPEVTEEAENEIKK